MMKVAFLIHSLEAPSCRYRVLQYVPYLRQQGVDISIYLFKRNLLDKLKFYNTLGQYDIVVIQRKLFFPIDFWYIRRRAKRIVYDFDDALMYRSARSKNPYSFSRRIKFAYMMRQVDFVIAGNHYLKSEVLSYNSNVVIIPTPIDLSRYRLKEYSCGKGPVTIGWLGSRSSLRYLKSLIPTFENISKKCSDVQFKMVCSEFLDSANVSMIEKKWSLDEEEEDLKSFDIGVMPLSNDLWSKGKCGLKILQYFSVGVPVVCTPVGINQDIVEDGINGFWAQNGLQWEDCLLRLIRDEGLRREMGLRGRETVGRAYSLEVNTPRFFSVLKEVMKKR